MSNVPPARDRMLTTAAAVLNGGKRYFYESGGMTPISTYTTRTLGVANAHPVVADSAGLFGPIWITPGTNYREILKDSSDNTLYDVDNLYPMTMDNSTLSASVYEVAENPNHYGALGTGSADESTYVQSAITAAVANSREGVVDLMGRYYRCDSALTLSSGVTIRNGTLDFSSCTANEYIKAQGTQGSAVTLASNASAGDETITVTSTSGLANSDLVYIYDSSGNLNGELKRVTGTLTGPVRALLSSALEDPYTTANTGSYREITPVTDIRLENLVVIASPSAGSGNGHVVYLERCSNAVLRNVRVQGHKGSAVEVRQSINTHIADCTLEQTTGSIASAGINICDTSTDTVVRGCSFIRQDTAGIDIGNNTGSGVGGVTRSVAVSGCLFDGLGGPAVWARLQSHGVYVSGSHVRAANTDVSATTTQAAAYGFRLDGYDTLVTDCTIRGIATAGFYIDFTSSRSTAAKNRRLRINGNSMTASALFVDGDITTTVDRIEISNNSDSDVSTSSVGGVDLECSGSGNLRYVTVSGNQFGGLDDGGNIEINAATTGTLGRVVVSNNVVPEIFVYGNSSTYATDVVISGNTCDLRSTAQGVITAQYVRRVTVANNAITASGGTSTTFGVYVLGGDATTSASISGNSIRGTGFSTTSFGINVSDFDTMSVVGNTLDGEFRYGIYAASVAIPVSSLSVTGNSIDTSRSSGAGVYVVSNDATNKIYNAVITGNSIDAPSVCIDLEAYIEGGAITGNACNTDTGSTQCILLNGSATSAMNNIAITGNAIREAAHGIKVTNGALVMESGNSFYSQSTGFSTGVLGHEVRCLTETVTRASMTDGGGTSGTKALSIAIPAGARYLFTTATGLTGFTGDTTAVIIVGDGTDTDRYNTGTPSVFTAASQGLDLGVPSGTAWHTSAKTVTVTITSTADFTNVNAGSIDLQFWFLAPIN